MSKVKREATHSHNNERFLTLGHDRCDDRFRLLLFLLRALLRRCAGSGRARTRPQQRLTLQRDLPSMLYFRTHEPLRRQHEMADLRPVLRRRDRDERRRETTRPAFEFDRSVVDEFLAWK